MIRDRRIASYIVIALIVGVALAFAVVLSRSDSSASTLSPQAAAAAAQTGVASDTAANDAAKQQPTLDQFTSKDPFVPLVVADNSATTTSTSTSTSDTNLTAVIKVNGSTQTVAVGDKVPSSNPVFTITAITSSDVTFKLVSGQFADGSSSVTVSSGQAVKVVDSGSNKSFTLAVTSIGTSGSSGGSGSGSGSGSSTSSHTINVASISSQNGTALVTFVVDGKTYSDVKAGAVISTSWGQIKVLSISVTQQTVTIMHGDATLTLDADQTVTK
jgi:hypothetical protein